MGAQHQLGRTAQDRGGDPGKLISVCFSSLRTHVYFECLRLCREILGWIHCLCLSSSLASLAHLC